MADRYTYLPMIGVLIAAVWGLADLVAGHRLARAVAAGAAVAAIIACAMLTWVQIGHWRDQRALLEHTLAVTDDNYLAEDGMALILLREGNYALAEEHARRAIDLDPNYFPAYNRLGNIRLEQGDVAGALDWWTRGVAIEPRDTTMQYNLGITYLQLRRWDEAEFHFRKVLERTDSQAVRLYLRDIERKRAEEQEKRRGSGL
jgi:tetratricopeptide (TPR) repeat protein